MNKTGLRPDRTAEFESFLKARRLRKTPERFAILDRVGALKGHFDIEGLSASMDADGFHVSRQTLYTTVRLLCECGILRKRYSESGAARYETSDARDCHLICNGCGKVKEIDDRELQRFFNARKYSAFSTEYFAVYVYGLCSSCLRRSRKKGSGSAPKKNNKHSDIRQ